jgi:peptidyl-prolyl cis-trans isomerase A (cyclophilin A)
MVNSSVFFGINSRHLGYVCFELFADKVPRTVENIYALSTGEKGFGYKGSYFHRTIAGVTCQGGDFTPHCGGSGSSIHGEKFDDENSSEDTSSGILPMTNVALGTNVSPFFICVGNCKWFDSKHNMKDDMSIVETREWHFGPGMARTTRRLPLPAVNNSNTTDLF